MSNKPYHFNEKFASSKFAHMRTAPVLVGHPAEAVGPLYRRMPYMQRVATTKSQGYGTGIARFLILVYDRTSPFLAEYPDITERRFAVARFCEIKRDSQMFTMLSGLSDELVANALCDLLKFQGDIVWDLITQYEKVFDDNRRKILVGENAKSGKAGLDYVKLVKENRALAEDIKGLYVKLTGNDPEVEMAVMRIKPLRAEDVARMVPDFDMPDYSPAFMDGEGRDEEE